MIDSMHAARRATFAAAAAMAFAAPSSLAETVTYTGTGTYTVSRSVLPLANGAAAVQLYDDVVATIAPSESGFLYGDCAGLGYADADGTTQVQAYCTFHELGDDAFVVRLALGPGGDGEAEILGGSGKWDGATGSGTFEPRHTGDYRGTYGYEFRITTP